VVLATGGLGPTQDDITRDAIAVFAKEYLPLMRSSAAAEAITQP